MTPNLEQGVLAMDYDSTPDVTRSRLTDPTLKVKLTVAEGDITLLLFTNCSLVYHS